MEIPAQYKEVLIRIYDSDNHCIKGEDLAKLKIDYAEIDDILEGLINKDLVEYEANENTYYLAYEGFEIVEEMNGIKQEKKTIYKSDTEQYKEVVASYGEAKQFQRMTLKGVLIIGVLISIFIYVYPEAVERIGGSPKNKIDESTLKQIEWQLQELVDSIQNAKREERSNIKALENNTKNRSHTNGDSQQ